MTEKLNLDIDEVVILKEVAVSHGDTFASFTDDLILTNKKIICQKRGMFGGLKETYIYPLEQIKTYNGVPQAKQGKLRNGIPCLDVYLQSGEEHFVFREENNEEIIFEWVSEIQKAFGLVPQLQFSKKQSTQDKHDVTIVEDFKEVGHEFAEVGHELASAFGEVFGIKIKKNNSTVNNNGNGIKNEIEDSQTKKTDIIICSKCGTTVAAGYKFCTECGTPLEDKPITYYENNEEVVEKQPQNIDMKTKENLSIDQQIELLKKLKELVDAGILSQEEFEKKKKELL